MQNYPSCWLSTCGLSLPLLKRFPLMTEIRSVSGCFNNHCWHLIESVSSPRHPGFTWAGQQLPDRGSGGWRGQMKKTTGWWKLIWQPLCLPKHPLYPTPDPSSYTNTAPLCVSSACLCAQACMCISVLCMSAYILRLCVCPYYVYGFDVIYSVSSSLSLSVCVCACVCEGDELWQVLWPLVL